MEDREEKSKSIFKKYLEDKKEKKKKKEEDAEWITFVQNEVEEHPIKKYHHPYMALAKNFYKGEQYKAIDEETGAIFDVKITRENRSKNNFIKLFIKTWAAKMLAGNPVPQLSAHEGNTEDFDGDVANVSQDLLSVLIKKEFFRSKNATDVKNAGKMGFAVAKVYFDADSGPSIGRMFGLEDLEEGEDSKMGSIRRDIVNPLHFFPDPNATSHHDMRWACHRYPMSKTVAEDIFGLERGSLEADDKSESREDIKNTTVTNDGYNESEYGENNDIVYINDIYIRASKKYKKGKHIIVIGKTVVVNEANPQRNGLPFIMLKINAEDDEIVSKSYAYDLINAQRDYNKMNSIIMENAESSGYNKWYCERDRDYSEITNDSWGIVTGNSPEPPKLMQAKPLPEYLVTGPQRVFQIAQDIMNLHNVDFSQVPTRGTNSSGKVIDELKESSRVAFAEDIGRIKEYLEEIYLKALGLYQKHFSVMELATIVGKNKIDKLKKFKKVTLSPTSYDMAIRIADGFAQSPSTKFQQVLDMVNAGIFDSPHLNMIMKLMDNDGNTAMLVESQLADEVKAKHNLDLVLSGKVPKDKDGNPRSMISQYDNHDVHKKVFQDFVKKPEWFTLTHEQHMAIDRYIANMDIAKAYNMKREMEMKQLQQQIVNPQQPQMGAPGMMPPQMGMQQGALPTTQSIQQADENMRLGGVFADEFEQIPNLGN